MAFVPHGTAAYSPLFEGCPAEQMAETQRYAPTQTFRVPGLKWDCVIPASYIKRVVLCLNTLAMTSDMYLDGGVLGHLSRHLETIAVVLAASIVVPQLLVLFFLFANGMGGAGALARVALCPILSGLSLLYLRAAHEREDSPFWPLAIMLVAVSPEPYYQLCRSWATGQPTRETTWNKLAEGLVEGPCSAVLTLYTAILLSSVDGGGPPWLYQVSLLWSFGTITKAASDLHFYGQGPSKSEYMKVFWLLKFPEVLSQIVGFAFVAFLTRPLARDVQDLWQHSASFCVWMFVALELVWNFTVLRSVSPEMKTSVAAILAATMVVGGPPGFLSALDAALPAHALQHAAILASMGFLAAQLASPAHWRVLIEFYPLTTGLFAVAAPWACLAPTLFRTKVSFQCRLDSARSKLDEALLAGDNVMVALLLNVEGAEPLPGRIAVKEDVECRFIDTGRQGLDKWSGICEHRGMFYCCPFDASAVLQLEPRSRAVSFIETGKGEGGRKWSSICEYQGKLYCCPYNASAILVVNPIAGTVAFTETGMEEGGCKWQGICVHRGLLYCCPHNASSVLVFDPAAGSVSFIDTGQGECIGKWNGICEYRNRLYCCPFDASEVLVVDPDRCAVSFIDTGKGNGCGKWQGLCAHDGLLYCSPTNESSVLVIDPAACDVSFIETSSGQGGEKWVDFVQHGGLLYAGACRSSAVLVLDPATGVVDGIETGRGEDSCKWHGMCQYRGFLYCCPRDSSAVLAFDAAAAGIDRYEMLRRLGQEPPTDRSQYVCMPTARGPPPR